MTVIVTDTSAYMKEEEAAAWNGGVAVVPLGYTAGGQEYWESYSDRNGDFESLLKNSPKSATLQPPAEAYAHCFQGASARGDEVLCITLSARLSGTHSIARAAARGFSNVTVLDSRSTAGGLYLLVKKACELAQAGLSLPEMISALKEARERIKVIFSVADIGPLRDSGRIGFVRRNVEPILNIKPLLILQEGAVFFESMARGDTQLIKKLSRMAGGRASGAVINYLGNNAPAANLYNIMGGSRPGQDVVLRKFGPVLGVHLGLHVIAVSFMTPGGG